jgi:hypothetical protein
MARTVPIARIRPGVVLTNHHLGFGGSVVVRCASGSLEGCASSTVTCADLAPFGGVPGALSDGGPDYLSDGGPDSLSDGGPDCLGEV